MSAYMHHGDCSTSDPCRRCFEFGETTERLRIIKLLEGGEHAWQLDVKQRFFGFGWKQKCRCGFYGVFNDHLVELIKKENE